MTRQLITNEWNAGHGASIIADKDRTQGLTTYFIKRFEKGYATQKLAKAV